jgi:hypothetical protein
MSDKKGLLFVKIVKDRKDKCPLDSAMVPMNY